MKNSPELAAAISERGEHARPATSACSLRVSQWSFDRACQQTRPLPTGFRFVECPQTCSREITPVRHQTYSANNRFQRRSSPTQAGKSHFELEVGRPPQVTDSGSSPRSRSTPSVGETQLLIQDGSSCVTKTSGLDDSDHALMCRKSVVRVGLRWPGRVVVNMMAILQRSPSPLGVSVHRNSQRLCPTSARWRQADMTSSWEEDTPLGPWIRGSSTCPT